MKYISYSLFKAKQHTPRAYDPHQHEGERYWYNIPFLAAVNKLAYPDYQMKVYICPDTRNHPLFSVLQGLSDAGLLTYEGVAYPYTNTQPTLWRMIPVWEGHDLFCRDIDSVPNHHEIRASLAFLNSSFIVQSMRTHGHHNGWPCRFLAGLCGFKSAVKEHIGGTFLDYYNGTGGHWGCDQDSLGAYFCDQRGSQFVKECMLDTVVYTVFPMAEHLAGHDAGKLPPEAYANVDLSYINGDLLDLCNGLTVWPGQPVNTRGEPLRKLLTLADEPIRLVKSVLERDDALRKFYQV